MLVGAIWTVMWNRWWALFCTCLLYVNASFTFPPDGWDIIFEESFDDPSLPQWEIWQNKTHGRKEHVCYLRDQVTVEGGLLKLRAAFRPNTRCGDNTLRNFTSGWIETNAFKSVPNSSCFYLIAANCSLPPRKYVGLWPAAWTWAQNGCWPGGGEIDVVEGNSNPLFPAATASYHWSHDPNCRIKNGDNRDMEKKGFGALYAPLRSELHPDFWTDFHVFYATWSRNQLEFYLFGDSEPTYVKRASEGTFIANTSQKLILDLDVQPLDEDWLHNYDDESMFQVDFFNVYMKCDS